MADKNFKINVTEKRICLSDISTVLGEASETQCIKCIWGHSQISRIISQAFFLCISHHLTVPSLANCKYNSVSPLTLSSTTAENLISLIILRHCGYPVVFLATTAIVIGKNEQCSVG